MKLILASLLLLILITGCFPSNKYDLFQYKDSYVGDNSAIGAIVAQLENKKHLEGFELKTDKEPYGIILNYMDGIEAAPMKETVIYNATFLFALVSNVEWITFNIGSETHTVKKDELTGWYNQELSNFKNEEELKIEINKYLEDEKKVNELFIK